MDFTNENDDDYITINFSKKEVRFYFRKIRKLEEKAGKSLNIDELFDIALEKEDNNFVNFLQYTKVSKRRKFLEPFFLIAGIDFWDNNGKPKNYTEEEVDHFEEILEEYWKDGVLNFYETACIAFENKNFDLINYLDYIEFKKDERNLERKILDLKLKTQEKVEKNFQSYINKTFKDLKRFKLVEEEKDADVYIIFYKKIPFCYDLRIKNDESEFLINAFDVPNCKIFFLKHKNPRDRKNSTLSYIVNKTPRSKANRIN